MFRSLAPLVLALPYLIQGASAQEEFLPTKECPVLGSQYPVDFDLEGTDAWAEAKESFPAVIDAIFESGVVNASISSFYIDVWSAATNKSLYSYSHQATAPAVNESFPEGGIDDNTIFRMGSVSKLFTVYSILVAAGGWKVMDDPVTQYLPELAGNPRDDPLKTIVWEDVTVGTLASHMAGTGQFPKTVLPCIDPDSSDPECNISIYLQYVKTMRAPSQALHRGGLYSDGGFGLLGRILERITGRTYHESLKSILGEKLGWNSTGTLMPTGEDVNGVIIPITNPGSSGWGFDNQITAPSGGVYSNAADMRAMGLSILNSKFLTASETRLWMKPRALLSSLTVSLGAPWEIYRLTLPVSANSTKYRVSDLYTKAGGNPGYTAVMALSPDHKIGYSVLVAGATAGADRWPLRTAVANTFVTAAEHAGTEMAKRNLAGTFVGPSNNTNLTLTVTEGHPGLGLPTFTINGLDAKLNMTQPLLTELPSGRQQVISLYPTGLEETLENGCKKIKFVAIVEYEPFAPRALIEGGDSLIDDGCTSWLSTAFFEGENSRFFDEFVLELDQSGTLVSVNYPVRELTLKRVKED